MTATNVSCGAFPMAIPDSPLSTVGLTYCRSLIVFSGLAVVASLALWLPTIREIELYEGFHTARLRLFVSGTVLGFLGGVAAGAALRMKRGLSRWAAAMLAANVLTAVTVVLYVCWPRTREVLQAVRRSDEGRIRVYAMLGANLDGRGRGGWHWHVEGETPLTAAVEQDDATMVQALLASGADVNATDGWRYTPLHQAVISKNAGIVSLLLANGADINQPGREGATPLITAIQFLSLDLVELLLSKGADPKLGCPIGAIALVTPEQMDANKVDETAISMAIQQLAKHGSELDCEQKSRRTPLTAAILARRANIVRFLVEAGADVDRADGHAETPLVVASQVGDLPSVRILLAGGADVSKSGIRGKTPLIASLVAGELTVAETLLQSGADITQEDGFGTSPVLAAVTGSLLKNRPEILRFALDRGANPARTNFGDNRNSPLARAAQSGGIEQATILLDAGVDPDEKHQESSTPLLVAIQHGHLEMVKLLISRGANVNWRGPRKENPLGHARLYQRRDIEAYLIEHGAQPAL